MQAERSKKSIEKVHVEERKEEQEEGGFLSFLCGCFAAKKKKPA